jgi:hypothetical protein
VPTWPILKTTATRRLDDTMQIDTRFLTIHPATVVWWAQRPQCESCQHMRLKRGDGNEGVMRCAVARHPNENVRMMLAARVSADTRPYCIDARGETGSCGPEARRWEPASG